MAQTRPTAVTVMAILNLVVGSLLLLLYLCNSIGVLMQAANPNQGLFGGGNDQVAVNLDREVANAVPGYRVYQVGQSLVGLLLSVLLLLSGIGLLNLRRWGRSLALVWAVLMILMEIGTSAFQVLVVSPAMTGALRNVRIGRGVMDVSVIVTITNVFTVVFAVLLIVYAVVLYLMMMRHNVRAAFAGLPAPGAYEPDRMASGPYGAERPPPGDEGAAPEGGGEQGIRRNPWDY